MVEPPPGVVSVCGTRALQAIPSADTNGVPLAELTQLSPAVSVPLIEKLPFAAVVAFLV